MSLLVSILIWSAAGLGTLLKIYFAWEEAQPVLQKKSFRRHIRAVTIAKGSTTIAVYDPTNEADVSQLQSVAQEIVDRILTEAKIVPGDEFCNWILDDDQASNCEVPAWLCHNHSLIAVQTKLIEAYKHPDWYTEHVAVFGVGRKGNLTHISWTAKPAQSLYSGSNNLVQV